MENKIIITIFLSHKEKLAVDKFLWKNNIKNNNNDNNLMLM
jgi:hypothetical protein